MTAVIELKNVTKSYKGNLLFDAVDLTVPQGRIVGIVGPNGSGKSVLFKMMCGFVFPDHGEVYVEEKQIGKEKRFPEGVGMIIDRPGYIANKTGFENLKELAQIQNQIDEETIRKTMLMLGLNPDDSQKVKNYSLGMKQKLAIAQAIMENQHILILDEAFNALDHDSVESLRELLLAFREEGKTIVMTSHNREDIDYLCEDVYRINRGKLEKIV
ncbi:ATP-binding cassette domain-containing protein [Exiguobacterium sp. s189]|uniref:ABC transporter ATP-binding protein n=1 Tax=Exiguobacterium sp. s189 TaxID=2751263 RepID=UPI001BEC467F|nr:ATP-binding cassette domain-containing protein [Exiguobacterium sp. s189]